MRLTSLVLTFCTGAGAMCQSGAPAPRVPQPSIENPPGFQSQMSCSDATPDLSFPSIVPGIEKDGSSRTPAKWRWVEPQVHSKRLFGTPSLNSEAQTSSGKVFHWSPSNSEMQFCTLAQSGQPPTVFRPWPNLQPIPTQWPNAKFEKIPTDWPNLRVVPIMSQLNAPTKPQATRK